MDSYRLKTLTSLSVWLVILLALLMPLPLQAAHGISIDGKLKYPDGFSRFDYVAPDAKKGGSLTLHDLGTTFDKMNPFTLRGASPYGLESLIFETLAVPSLDEPFAEYGLIAKDIELAQDRLSVTFTLDERARFSDGSPVTAEDVKFSLETLKSDKAHPFYQIYLQDIREAEILGPARIRFHFQRVNRELHMIAAQLPVMSKAFYEKNPFDAQGEKSMVPPVASGPYLVDKIDPGKAISYRRNPDYWAQDHPARKGMFNFDRITVRYYKDQVVAVEAFKAGEFDFMAMNIAKQWQRDLVGRPFDSGVLVKKLFPHKNNAGMQGFVFNTRRPLFQDRLVRKALGLALDFEWINTSLFFDQYTRNNSFFSNSGLAATGLPQGAELALLEPFRDELPPEVFTAELIPPSTRPPDSLRANLLEAKKLLAQAGWEVRGGALRNAKGEEFKFEILLGEPSFERVLAPYVKNLEKLGIRAQYRTIDQALFTDRVKNFDFDMIVNVFGQSQSPGNEQRDYWHSAAADRSGSRNYAGIKSPVVDHLVDAIIYATTQEELTAACRALDRVLWFGYYVVPHWYLASHRLAYSSRFRQPEILPLYYSPDQLLMTWWDGTVK
ncbi:MAG: ABC transporter substrate-binding protein [Desulfobulbus sp.]|nr:MAG: ABC transporter substrate-binding protein [Desulfobulbus sp.]